MRVSGELADNMKRSIEEQKIFTESIEDMRKQKVRCSAVIVAILCRGSD